MKVYSTRFQGSKRRVLPWLVENIEKYSSPGDRIFDAFSGSGVVAYALASRGFQVSAADRMLSAEIPLQAFLGNKQSIVWSEIANTIKPVSRRDPLYKAYKGVFFPDEELLWLLGAAAYGRQLRGEKRAIFFWALFQASLAKRPYNLFHRSNLNMRTRSVKRSFGNARTWERPFPDLVEKFLLEQGRMKLASSSKAQFYHGDISRMKRKECDMIYLDPPYIPQKGESIDYLDFYGFLDILLQPASLIDQSKLHKPIKHSRSVWEKRDSFLSALEDISRQYSDVPLLLSYRSDGFPTLQQLQDILGSGTTVAKQPIQYALSKKSSAEVLLVRPPA